jgi:hypothetical protein
MERSVVMQLIMQVAKSYDGIDFCTLSEKENNFLNLFIEKGIGKVYNVYDTDGTTLMKYYKFNPKEEE